MIWLLFPSSPKGEIVGIMIHMFYLMATHSSQIINYTVEKSSRTFMQRKVHALLCRENFISCREKKVHTLSCWRTYLWSMVVHALLCREKFISCREKKVHALSCWRTYLWSMVVHTLLCREKFISCREKKFTHFHVGELTFGPW